MDYQLKDYYGSDWQNLVASGELGRLKTIFSLANKDNDQLIEDLFKLIGNISFKVVFIA